MEAPHSKTVVFVTSQLQSVNTGPGTYATYLRRAFSDNKDFEFYVLTDNWNTREQGILLVRFPANLKKIPGHAILRYWFFRRTLLRAFRNKKVDVIHCNSFIDGLYLSQKDLRQLHAKMIINVNDYYYAESKKSPFYYMQHYKNKGIKEWLSRNFWRYWEKIKLKEANIVVCNSSYVYHSVIGKYGIAQKKCAVIYKGIDIDNNKIIPNIGCNSKPSRILFVGKDWQRKGLADLVEVFGGILERFPDLILEIVGPGEESWKPIMDLGRRAMCMDKIRYFGTVERNSIRESYGSDGIFVLPTYKDSFPISILEAMASGMAVVTTRVGSIPDRIENLRDCLLISPGDKAALEHAVVNLLTDKGMREKIVIEGFKTANKSGMEDMISKIKDLYLQLLL